MTAERRALAKAGKACVTTEPRRSLAPIRRRHRTPPWTIQIRSPNSLYFGNIGDLEAKRLGRLEVDDQLELNRLHDGEVDWPRALVVFDHSLRVTAPVRDA
jgi:hypothetical protein